MRQTLGGTRERVSTQAVINLVFSFLGGGLVVGILDWVRSVRSETRARRAALISDQLRYLYGPLYFLTSQNAALFELTDAFQSAYSAEYIEQKYSPEAHERVSERASRTLSLSNKYIDVVKANNDRISELLSSAFAHIDPEDVTVFRRFLVDYLRLKTEIDPQGKMLTPIEIYEHVGDISFMRPEFIERIEQRFQEKKAELAGYARAS